MFVYVKIFDFKGHIQMHTLELVFFRITECDHHPLSVFSNMSLHTEGRNLLWTLDACDRPTGNTFVKVVFGVGTWA